MKVIEENAERRTPNLESRISLLLVVSGYSGASVLYIFSGNGERTQWLVGTEKRLREIAATDYAGVPISETGSRIPERMQT